MAFEAYSVAIRLRLLDSVSSGLRGMAGQFAMLNRHVGASQEAVSVLQKRLERLKTTGLIGGALLGAGAGGLALFRAPLDEAAKYQQEAAKFASLGFGAKVNADAQAFAKGMQTYGTSARDNLQLLSDAMAVFKNLGHAEIAAPLMARMKFANEAIFGEATGRANERKFMDMLKVIELRRGLSSSKEFATQANYVQQVISGSRNRVDASAMLQLIRAGGVGVAQMSNESFYLGLEPLVQEFGGFRLGAGLQSIYNNLVQGRSSITAQQELYRLGLLDPHKVKFNVLGQLKKALPGSFRGSEVFEREGPLALLEKVLLPAFARHGITKEADVIREIGLLLSDRRGSAVLSRAYQQRATIEMQTAANAHAQNIDQLSATARNTPQGKMLDLHKQYRNLLLELGTAALPIAIHAVQGLTIVLDGAVKFAREFPTFTKGLTVAFGTLAGLTAAGGAITLARVGFEALGLTIKSLGAAAMLASGRGGGAGRLARAGRFVAGATMIGSIGVAANDWLSQFHSLDSWSNLWEAMRGKGGSSSSSPSAFVRGGSSSTVQVRTQVNLDGRKVGEAVSSHQARAAAAPHSAISGFDGVMTPAPAGATGGW